MISTHCYDRHISFKIAKDVFVWIHIVLNAELHLKFIKS